MLLQQKMNRRDSTENSVQRTAFAINFTLSVYLFIVKQSAACMLYILNLGYCVLRSGILLVMLDLSFYSLVQFFLRLPSK